MAGERIYDLGELFAAIAEGNEAAFAIFFDEYKQRVFSVAYKMTHSKEIAQDLSQNFFLKFWQNRQALVNVTYPGGYIHRSVYNMALNYLAQEANEERFRKLTMLGKKEYSEITQESVDARQLISLINQAVSDLPLFQREVFRHRYHEQMEYADIAVQHKITVSTAKTYFKLALRHIREYITRAHWKGNGSWIAFLFFIKTIFSSHML
jgi:RNA polymerase sigma-70 factor (ECF subfamily)